MGGTPGARSGANLQMGWGKMTGERAVVLDVWKTYDERLAARRTSMFHPPMSR
jgi:hypothetical protein